MGVGSYLRLKGRASVFRRKVPEALRARLARTEICATLGIVSRDSAERGARQVAVAVGPTVFTHGKASLLPGRVAEPR